MENIEVLKIKPKNNAKKRMFKSLGISIFIIISVIILSMVLSENNLRTSIENKNMAPSLSHLFGTDWLGRDMFTRTVKGLRLSLKVGVLGSITGVVIATILGMCAAMFGKTVDFIISWLVDLFIGMPHLVFIILISFLVGGGVKGVVLGVSLTHWPSLTRVIRSEVLQVKNSEYIKISAGFGKSKWYIAKNHILPHIIPQVMVGFLLLFPHAILHEAAITFLGFGLSVQTPAIGIILAEAMQHISTGQWWLAFFPGLLLIIVIKSFDNIGENMRIITDPNSSNE